MSWDITCVSYCNLYTVNESCRRAEIITRPVDWSSSRLRGKTQPGFKCSGTCRFDYLFDRIVGLLISSTYLLEQNKWTATREARFVEPD